MSTDTCTDAVRKRILRDVAERVRGSIAGGARPAIYLDTRRVDVGEAIDLVDSKIEAERPLHYVFVDEQPGYNWGHACRYLLYAAEDGRFLDEVAAHFPPSFGREPAATLEPVGSEIGFDDPGPEG